jgi:hypothetical protein
LLEQRSQLAQFQPAPAPSDVAGLATPRPLAVK